MSTRSSRRKKHEKEDEIPSSPTAGKVTTTTSSSSSNSSASTALGPATTNSSPSAVPLTRTHSVSHSAADSSTQHDAGATSPPSTTRQSPTTITTTTDKDAATDDDAELPADKNHEIDVKEPAKDDNDDDDEKRVLGLLRNNKGFQSRLALEIMTRPASEVAELLGEPKPTSTTVVPRKNHTSSNHVDKGFKWADFPFVEEFLHSTLPGYKDSILYHSDTIRGRNYVLERLPDVVQLMKSNGYTFDMEEVDVQYRLRYWYNNKNQLARHKVKVIAAKGKLTTALVELVKEFEKDEEWIAKLAARSCSVKRGHEEMSEDPEKLQKNQKVVEKVPTDNASLQSNTKKAKLDKQIVPRPPVVLNPTTTATSSSRKPLPHIAKQILEKVKEIGSDEDYLVRDHEGVLTLAQTLQVLLHIKLASGLPRSAMKQCSDLIKTEYTVASDLLSAPEANEAELVDLRERLAHFWCVFAHLILEIGALVHGSSIKAEPISGDFYKYSFAILVKTQACPLVHNHAMTQIAMGRLYSRITTHGEEAARKSQMSHCWNGLSRCHGQTPDRPSLLMDLPTIEAVIGSMVKADIGIEPPKGEVDVSEEDLRSSMNEAIAQPALLRRPDDDSPVWFNDGNGPVQFCAELDRLRGEESTDILLDSFHHFKAH